jgi:hypothetical protein
MLTVPEEFAGQLMKCPLCSGTFTVPGLPGAAPPPPSGTESDIFSIRQDAPPPAPPVPHHEPLPPSPTSAPTAPPPAPLPPEDYQHSAAVHLSPKVLPWIAPVCLLLVFVLQFFDWVGLYPGGVPAATQNAWQAAFGSITKDGDLPLPALQKEKGNPGISALTIFYLLLFFPVLVVTVASVVIGMIPLKLPPAVEKLLPWRWGIVAAVNLILFLFLGLQVLLGFSLDSHYKEWVDKSMKRDSEEPLPTKESKLREVKRGSDLETLRHTLVLRLVVLLHLVATVCAALLFWIHQRGTHRPLPKLELRW